MRRTHLAVDTREEQMTGARFLGALTAALLVIGVAASDLRAQSERYPFACCTQLYGYLPDAVWNYGSFLRISTYSDSARVQVTDLSSGELLIDSLVRKSLPVTPDIHDGVAYKIVSDEPITALMGSLGAGICPGMSFVPSSGNGSREFMLDFPETSPGWGLPYQHYLTLFAWEEADVVVRDMISDTIVWSGHIAPHSYEKLVPPEGRYAVTSTGTLTVELLSTYDSSSFVLDADQDGCGEDFMFHVYSLGLAYGRHSYYEVHGFDDAFVTVYDIDDPLSPVVFDTFSISSGGHYTRSFDRYDNVFRIESTGRISVTAGSYQTEYCGPGPEAAGDYYSSVPSLGGEGREFMLGLHCGHLGYGDGGIVVIAAEDSTTVTAGSDTFELDADGYVWIAQPAAGIVYYEITSSRPVCVLTGSIGGDNDFDNVMSYLPGLPGGELGTVEAGQKMRGVARSAELSGVFPNPFQGSTVIEYNLPSAARVKLTIRDVAGRLVEVLVDSRQGPGSYGVIFEGRGCASGRYFCHLEVDQSAYTRSLVLIR